jgi:hypothetical protein
LKDTNKPTRLFKKKKIECYIHNSSQKRKIYDMVIYDSPGYDKSLNKEWIYDILKKIKEKVTKFKLEFRIQRN